jgi:hypothetical protein
VSNVKKWEDEMRAAITARDADTLARLMSENDRNGCFTYADVCLEFGETTRDEWIDGTIECAEEMLAELPNHTDTTKE